MRALRVLDSATGASRSSVTVMSDAINGKETGNQDERELPKLHDVRLLHFGSNQAVCIHLALYRVASITCILLDANLLPST